MFGVAKAMGRQGRRRHGSMRGMPPENYFLGGAAETFRHASFAENHNGPRLLLNAGPYGVGIALFACVCAENASLSHSFYSCEASVNVWHDRLGTKSLVNEFRFVLERSAEIEGAAKRFTGVKTVTSKTLPCILAPQKTPEEGSYVPFGRLYRLS